MTRKDGACLVLYLTFAVATGFADLRMRAHTANVVDSFIPGVVANTEYAPGKYRVLVPYLVEYTAKTTGMTRLTSWYVTRLLWIFAAFAVFHVYLRTWFAEGESLAGVGIVAATLPLTFTNSWPHPDHMAELALFTAGALAVARGADGLFAAILALAAFNRETSVFLVALYLVGGPLNIPRLLRTALFGAEWFAIYAGLRWVRGLQHYDYWQAARNLADLRVPLPADLYDPYYRLYAYFGLALFGPMLFIALRHLRTAPFFARRALLVAPMVAAVAFLFSNIIESRIFTPLYPLVLPAVMAAVSSTPRGGVDRA